MASCSTCTRLLARVAPPLLIAALIFMAVSGYTLLKTSRSEIDNEVARYADSLEGILETMLLTGQKDALAAMLSTIASNPAMRRAEVYDAHGALFAAQGNAAESTTIHKSGHRATHGGRSGPAYRKPRHILRL